MKKLSQLLDFEPWEIAKFDISETEIRKVLGEPHYIETRHMMVADGIETRWAYELDGEPFALVCKVSYEYAAIYVKFLPALKVIEKVRVLFPNSEINLHKVPIKRNA